MASLLIEIQGERDQRTLQTLSTIDPTIASQIITQTTPPTLPNTKQHATLTIQCAYRMYLAKKMSNILFFQQYHQEEKERQKRSERQVTEGIALVNQNKLTQEMSDQAVLDRQQAIKTDNTNLALQIHAQSPSTIATEDELNQRVREALKKFNSDEEEEDTESDSTSDEKETAATTQIEQRKSFYKELKLNEQEQNKKTSPSSAPSAPLSSNSKIIKPPRSKNSKKNSTTHSHQAGQKKGRVMVRKVIVEGREFAVKDDSAADGEDEDEGSSNFSFSSQSETEDNDLQKDKNLKEKISNEKGMKETPGMKWSKRVLEFQCNKTELMQLRNVELKSRIRDLEVLLSQLSNTMMDAMMESSELMSQTEILDITIGQLMERLDPGNINIKTGAHKKGRSYPKPNTTRKFFGVL
jgi:hypothetical protein